MKDKHLRFKFNKFVLLLFLLIGMAGITKVEAQAPEGAINGLFSVSATRQVYFSQGNLQYQASTNTWRFAPAQWYYIGDNNSNISSTYTGYIDLFGWGTSGYNHGATCYQPWGVSDDNSHYFAYGHSNWNLSQSTGKADWGYNPISDGGNTENYGWRTLSKTEWEYLLNTRSTTSGIRYAKAVVSDKNGLILLPDNWSDSYYSLNNTNSPSANYSGNNITDANWTNSLESHGAVFLPAAGHRINNGFSGTAISYAGTNGTYWSSTYQNTDNHYYAYVLDIDGNYNSLSVTDVDRRAGFSVRLVRVARFDINTSSSPVDGGTVTGGGSCLSGSSCTLTAAPNPNYVFLNWTEGENIVSTDAAYTFTVTGHRTLVANFVEPPLTYSYNSSDYTATVAGFQNGVSQSGPLVIPNAVTYNNQTYTVTAIGNYAFWNCTGLTSVTIGNSVTTIGNIAFNGCTGLTSVTIGNSVTSIGNYAFSNCSGLTSIVIPNSVTHIGSSAFCDCSGLTSIVIPNSVTSIGSSAFSGCSSLEQIIVNSANSTYDSRNNCNAIINTSSNELVAGCKNTVIPNSVTSIGDYAFFGCTGLTSIEIPNSVTSIGDWAFYGCTGLTSIEIPNSVTSIGRSAFRGCTGLTSIEIPNSVISIGDYAFYDCSSLTSITVHATTPPTLDNGHYTYAFHHTSCPIYVPYESLNAYKTTIGWYRYSSRIYPWMEKSIAGYSTSTISDKWVFIASPLAENTSPTAIDNMLAETATEYDLYRLNQAASSGQWENYKAHTTGFVLENGQGYLYANKSNVNLVFKGTFNEGTSKTVDLAYTAGKPSAGWNLVGNPFPYPATVSRSYYVMNEYGTSINPTALSAGTSIEACTGIVVKAETTGESVTFAKVTRQNSMNHGLLHIAVANEDNAIVSFNEGDQLGKFYFGEQNANIYIPQGQEEYAIAYSNGQGEMPVNFRANANSTYTITVNPENVEMAYLHLIDNLTGTDVDLLQTPEYSFNAKTTDYESRFRLVFSANEDTNGDDTDAPFAFINNGNIIVNGEGNLQVIDMMGRVIVSGDAKHCVSTMGMVPGVYVINLINGEDMKTQKIVVR